MTIDSMLMAALTILGGAIGFVWKLLDGRNRTASEKIEALQEKVREIELKIAGELVNHEALEKALDSKLNPIILAINSITDWIERQNGVPSLRGRIPTPGN